MNQNVLEKIKNLVTIGTETGILRHGEGDGSGLKRAKIMDSRKVAHCFVPLTCCFREWWSLFERRNCMFIDKKPNSLGSESFLYFYNS